MILCRKTRGSFNDGASVHEKTTAQDKLRRKGANARQGTTLASFRLADNKGAKAFYRKTVAKADCGAERRQSI